MTSLLIRVTTGQDVGTKDYRGVGEAQVTNHKTDSPRKKINKSCLLGIFCTETLIQIDLIRSCSS